MTRPKVVLVVLVLTAVLFAVGLGLGVGRNDPGKVDLRQLRQNALVKAAEGMFVKKEKLDVTRLTTDGRREGNAMIIEQGATCRLDIPPGDADVRSVTLRLTQGNRATLAFRANDSPEMTLKQPLEAWTKPGLPAWGASAVGLLASPHGPGPLLAVSALAAGRTGEPVELQVFRQGGTLSLTCEDGSGQPRACRVVLE